MSSLLFLLVFANELTHVYLWQKFATAPLMRKLLSNRWPILDDVRPLCDCDANGIWTSRVGTWAYWRHRMLLLTMYTDVEDASRCISWTVGTDGRTERGTWSILAGETADLFSTTLLSAQHTQTQRPTLTPVTGVAERARRGERDVCVGEVRSTNINRWVKSLNSLNTPDFTR